MTDQGTTVDHVDTESLEAVQRLLGAERPSDAVNEALRETVRRKTAEQYIEFMKSRELPFDIREQAWRS